MNFRHWSLSMLAQTDVSLPNGVLTRTAFDAGGALDAATALLLPSGSVEPPSEQLQAINGVDPGDDTCLGLWLATPHPLGQDVLAKFKETSLGWVTNFPSCEMFGATFARQLSEVGTGTPQEWAALAAIQDQGKRIMLTVTTGDVNLPNLAVDAVLLVIQSAEDLKALSHGFVGALHDAFGKETPIVLHGGANGHLPRDPSAIGVTAVLNLPS